MSSRAEDYLTSSSTRRFNVSGVRLQCALSTVQRCGSSSSPTKIDWPRLRLATSTTCSLRATAVVRRFPELFNFSAVIVDEVQDLNLAAVQFLIALAGDQPERLLFIGDGQQSVYPGGFTLSEAGITVAGRAAVLTHNYRNTVQILEEARRMVSAETFDNFEGIPDLGAATAEASRQGHPPITVLAETQHDLDAALTSQLQRTRDWDGTPWGHMAVLAERTRTVDHYRRVLTKAGIPFVELTDYDGESSDRVKIGTIKRAKGLEFAYVLIPGLSQEPPGMASGETADSHAERVERWRRELYVAMTRARDGLWLGYLGGPKPVRPDAGQAVRA